MKVQKKNSTLIISIASLFNVAMAQDTKSEVRDKIENEILQSGVISLLEKADNDSLTPLVSPVRRINRVRPVETAIQSGQENDVNTNNLRRPTPGRPGAQPPVPTNSKFRTINGENNNSKNKLMGSANQPLFRLMPSDYSDGVSSLSGQSRASARAISNVVFSQSDSLPNRFNASDFVWQWGQFLDHDIDLTDGVDPVEPANIPVPSGDVYFDPEESGTKIISMNRSIYDRRSGNDSSNPRQQLNEITNWIDASNVYGSDEERAFSLRTNDGTGKMKSSEGNFLPFNVHGLPNAGGDSAELFIAGDVRANEQLGLTAMHTLFMREHNWQAGRIQRDNPNISGEEIYQRARQIVGAEIQAITYYEYLPALLGRNALSNYTGYKPEIDARIANLFSTAIFRYGHSALSPTIKRLDSNGESITQGDLALRDAFFSPQKLIDEGGIEPILRGLASQVSQKVDNYVIDDVRNFLFGPPGSGGFDLVSLNIQRGRDHGLPTYNTVRQAYGLDPINNFSDITSDILKQQALATVYQNVNEIDLWVGGLCEDPIDGSMVGELISVVIKEQFEALRDGDRYWFENILNRQQRDEIKSTKLSDVIRRNTLIDREISEDVFHVRRQR